MRSLVLAFLVLGTSIFVHADPVALKLQKLKTINSLGHPVVFQSQDLHYSKSTGAVYGKVISQWGLQVFEVGVVSYKCKESTDTLSCKAVGYQRRAMFEKCVVRGDKAVCSNKIIGSETESSVQPDFKADDLVDSVKDQMHRDQKDENDEFPARDSDNVDSVEVLF